MKKLFLILTLVAAMLLSAATALAASPSLRDNANLLSKADKAKVEQTLKKIEKKYNVRLGVVTMKSIGDKVPGEYANSLIDKVYNNGADGNMVLLQVVDQRKWYVSTDKKLKDVVVGNEGVEYMSKKFVPLMKEGDYLSAYNMYALKAGELLKYYQKNGRGWEPEKEFPWGALYIALVTAAIVTYFYKLGLLATMSNVNKQVEANAYLNKESFTLKESEDSFMYSTVTVTLVSSSKDNGSDDGSVTDSSSDGDHGGGGGDY